MYRKNVVVLSKKVYHIEKDFTIEQLFDYVRVNKIDVFLTKTSDSFHPSHGIHLEPARCLEIMDYIRSGWRYERIWDAGIAYEPEYKTMAEELEKLTEWVAFPVIRIFNASDR